MQPLLGPKGQAWFGAIALILQPLNASAAWAQFWSLKWALVVAALLGGISNALMFVSKFGVPSNPSKQ